MTATLNPTEALGGIAREVETTYDPHSPDQIRQAAYIAAQAADVRVNIELETEDGMTVNMGPQHPATHGTLRLIAKLDGEQVVSCEPVMGYMHRGYEKLTEVRTYPQVTTLVNMRFASHLGEGAISYIYWADRLLELPLSLVSVSLGTALLPTLAAMWSRQEGKRMSETTHFYLRPISLWFYFGGKNNRGQFGSASRWRVGAIAPNGGRVTCAAWHNCAEANSQ